MYFKDNRGGITTGADAARSGSACDGQGKELDLALLDTGRQDEGMALLVAAVRPRWIVTKEKFEIVLHDTGKMTRRTK